MATGIVRMTKERLETDKSDTAIRKLEKLTAKDIIECAKNGDKMALSFLTDLDSI